MFSAESWGSYTRWEPTAADNNNNIDKEGKHIIHMGFAKFNYVGTFILKNNFLFVTSVPLKLFPLLFMARSNIYGNTFLYIPGIDNGF